MNGSSQRPQTFERRLTNLRKAALGLLWLAWTFGSELGLRSATTAHDWDLDTRLLLASWGGWAVVASGSLVALVSRRSRLMTASHG